MLGVLDVADIERSFGMHKRVEFFTKELHVGGVFSEIVEDVGQHDSDGIAARHDDQAGVTMQPLGCLAVAAVLRGFEQRRRHIRHGDLRVAADLCLFRAPGDEAAEVTANEGSDGADGNGPRNWRKEPEEHHGGFEPVDGEVHFAGLEHGEGFAKGEVAHGVEGEVVEPGGDVHGGVGELGDFADELVGVEDYAVFVVSEGWSLSQSPRCPCGSRRYLYR